MAPSSTSSCSPPAARQYNLRTKRAKTNHKASIYSKRPTRDQVVDGPPKKKKSANLDDYVRDISETVVAWSSNLDDYEQEELDLVVQILEQDGINKGSDLYRKALYVCKDPINRCVFIKMKTREGRLHWIEFNWTNK